MNNRDKEYYEGIREVIESYKVSPCQFEIIRQSYRNNISSGFLTQIPICLTFYHQKNNQKQPSVGYIVEHAIRFFPFRFFIAFTSMPTRKDETKYSLLFTVGLSDINEKIFKKFGDCLGTPPRGSFLQKHGIIGALNVDHVLKGHTRSIDEFKFIARRVFEKNYLVYRCPRLLFVPFEHYNDNGKFLSVIERDGNYYRLADDMRMYFGK